MRVKIQGKVGSSQVFEGSYLTCIITPAPDEYTSPSMYRVRSSQPLGAPETNVTLDCSISGFVKKSSYVDRETGERKAYLDPKVFFDVMPSAQPRSQS